MAGKKWVKLGTLKRKDKSKPSYIVLDKNVEILVAGEKVKLSKYRTVKLVDPVSRLDALKEKGIITEEEHTTRLQQLEENGVQYELTIPPEQE